MILVSLGLLSCLIRFPKEDSSKLLHEGYKPGCRYSQSWVKKSRASLKIQYVNFHLILILSIQPSISIYPSFYLPPNLSLYLEVNASWDISVDTSFVIQLDGAGPLYHCIPCSLKNTLSFCACPLKRKSY